MQRHGYFSTHSTGDVRFSACALGPALPGFSPTRSLRRLSWRLIMTTGKKEKAFLDPSTLFWVLCDGYEDKKTSVLSYRKLFDIV